MFVVRFQGGFVLSRYGDHRQISLLPEVLTPEQAEVWTDAKPLVFDTEAQAQQAIAAYRVRRPHVQLTVEAR